MRNIARTAIVSALLLIAASSLNAEPIKVLLLSGLNNHDWRVTTPRIKEILEGSGRFVVEVTENPESFAPEKLAEHDVIVSNWNSWNNVQVEEKWSPELRDAYLEYVRSGKGHVAVHAGSSSFYDWPEMQNLYGAFWDKGVTSHPGIFTFSVRMTASEHPITKGVPDFEIRDELWIKPGIKPHTTVLAESFNPREGGGGTWEPSLIAHSFGEGRSTTLLLGHDVTAMRNQGFATLLLRATEWAATGDVSE